MHDNDQIKPLLAAIAVNNDQAAYKELFILLHPRLKQFAFSILHSGEEAEELVSDIFIGIWQKRDSLLTIESPLFYFFATAKNLAINRLRKINRQQNNKPEDWFIHYQGLSLSPEELMITNEMAGQIRKAINELPPRCKLIFTLIKEDGLKYREVAKLLELSIKTIEAQMAIAFKKISHCMQLDVKKLIDQKYFQKK